jgi:hypothetical protein
MQDIIRDQEERFKVTDGYYEFRVICAPIFHVSEGVVLPVNDIFQYAANSGQLDFWKNSAEDLYTLEDGTPIE